MGTSVHISISIGVALSLAEVPGHSTLPGHERLAEIQCCVRNRIRTEVDLTQRFSIHCEKKILFWQLHYQLD